jgi:cytochrome c oxidase cbb3-type subunit 3
MSKRDVLLGHAVDADGIDEYDNPPPDWWLGMAYLLVIWAVGYGIWYHFIGKVSQEGKLAAELAAAEARWPRREVDAGNLDMSPAAVAAGRDVYARSCVGCHGAERQGGIGPNLADTVWVHGSDPASIFRVIYYGVPEKGMPNWGQMIGPEQVAQVAAYVIHNKDSVP